MRQLLPEHHPASSLPRRGARARRQYCLHHHPRRLNQRIGSKMLSAISANP
jgi:hypothetical protein